MASEEAVEGVAKLELNARSFGLAPQSNAFHLARAAWSNENAVHANKASYRGSSRLGIEGERGGWVSACATALSARGCPALQREGRSASGTGSIGGLRRRGGDPSLRWGQWYEFQDGRWHVNAALKPGGDSQFTFADSKGLPVQAPVPWREVRQLVRAGATNYVAGRPCLPCRAGGSVKPLPLGWPESLTVRQMAISPDGVLHVGSSAGLWALRGKRVAAGAGPG